MIVQDHDKDLQWEGTNWNHDQVPQQKEEEVDTGTAESPLTIVGNHIQLILVGEILVKGEAGGVWDEDLIGHGLEVRNLNRWQDFLLPILF